MPNDNFSCQVYPKVNSYTKFSAVENTNVSKCRKYPGKMKSFQCPRRGKYRFLFEDETALTEVGQQKINNSVNLKDSLIFLSVECLYTHHIL